VGINSFTRSPDGVNKVAEETERLFKPLGFERAEFLQADQNIYGKHLALTRPAGPLGRKAKRRIGFISHSDTVFPYEVEIGNCFKWEEEGGALGTIYGPGTMDIKAGTIMQALVLDALQECEPEVFESIQWELLFNAAEEEMAADFQHMCRRRLGADGECVACLVFEAGAVEVRGVQLPHDQPPDLRFKVVSQRPGMAVWRVVARGVEAHAGNSHALGRSAIHMISRLVVDLEEVTNYNHDDVGGITVNVGSISGGTAHNTVPGFCEVLLEMRARTTATFDEGIKEVEAVIDQHSQRINSESKWVDAGASGKRDTHSAAEDLGSGGGGARLDMHRERVVQPWEKNKASEALVHVWREATDEMASFSPISGALLPIPDTLMGGYAPSDLTLTFDQPCVPYVFELIDEKRGGLSDGNWLWSNYPTLDGLGVSGASPHCSGPRAEGKATELMHWNTVVHKALLNCLAIMRLVEGRAANERE
jgi:acetylornithine deacetylase/succinyl-diaminopimelate desuccinylase-like protein